MTNRAWLRSPLLAAGLLAALALSGCREGDPAQTGAPGSPAATLAPTPTPSPTPPPLSLTPPGEHAAGTVDFRISPNVPAEGAGQLLVTVVNAGDVPIGEIVVRWPTELDATLSLAPFQPTPDRIAEGGPPLVQDWTKWVVGPGTRGEPPGTTSLGWGPLDPGATLEIPIVATRRAAGEIAFDVQFLDGNGLLRAPDGGPAHTRVVIPP